MGVSVEENNLVEQMAKFEGLKELLEDDLAEKDSSPSIYSNVFPIILLLSSFIWICVLLIGSTRIDLCLLLLQRMNLMQQIHLFHTMITGPKALRRIFKR